MWYMYRSGQVNPLVEMPVVLYLCQELSRVLLVGGDYAGSAAVCKDLEGLCVEAFGAGHPDTATARLDLAAALAKR